jgi:predicted short-subunit dehydrogenase-like oxidoreductase (DUF2520 family)
MTAYGNSNEIRSVVMVGAGNLAWHLGHNLQKSGLQIIQVVNRNPAAGKQLAAELGAAYCDWSDSMRTDADLYMLAVSDDAIGSALDNRGFIGNGLVVHVAGSVPMDIFYGRAANYGVLYPLQTFTKGVPTDFGNIPIFIEANTIEALTRLEITAGKLSQHVHRVDSDTRIHLHLTAVIASNFSNHLLSIAHKLLLEKGLSFDLLKPLIRETISKAMIMSPMQAQTGPAVRGNMVVIDKHLELLKPHPEIREIYRLISEHIMAEKNLLSLKIRA